MYTILTQLTKTIKDLWPYCGTADEIKVVPWMYTYKIQVIDKVQVIILNYLVINGIKFKKN